MTGLLPDALHPDGLRFASLRSGLAHGAAAVLLALSVPPVHIASAAPTPGPAAPAPSAPATAPAESVPRGPVGPLAPTVQKTQCHSLRTLAGTDYTRLNHAQRTLRFDKAWRFSRGEGQRVAVIDTGVNPHPRLGPVEPGGDYVSTGDGRDDCDAHGTAVAGIIAAREAPGDAFVGVAPAATIIAIRQASGAFEPRERGVNSHGNVTTMAYAVVRAVDLGATVINISEVACGAAGVSLGDEALARAVRYAFDRNVVVVAAAGNVSNASACAEQNENPDAPVTVASPARFSDQVIAVAATEPDGRAAKFSLAGPWVTVAAPGTDVTTLDPHSSGLANAMQTREGVTALAGTSFATPYVAGLAALIRSKYPHLTAAQVRTRIISTARDSAAIPAGALGAGVIDPLAALTAAIPGEPMSAGAITPEVPTEIDTRPRNTALIGTAVLITLVCIAAMIRQLGPRRD